MSSPSSKRRCPIRPCTPIWPGRAGRSSVCRADPDRQGDGRVRPDHRRPGGGPGARGRGSRPSPPRRPSSSAAGAVTERLTGCWPRATPTTPADALMEIKSGEGGEESALFAGGPAQDVLPVRRDPRLEDRGARRPGDRSRLQVGQCDQGPRGRPDPMPYGVLKFEGGVHRVQRVPVTESQGRVHTSAAGVLVVAL